ncbi:MAG TPA: amidohydrolase family protein, partial [Jatrophihabitantaceae bacterium]|nr:amidohydrolase family protein [Jatrophihabitantaceae bacterium]
IVTAPGGYPSATWGRDGFAAFAADPAQARVVVHRLAMTADVIKIALEPGPAGWPVPDPATVRAVVEAAHSAGLLVVAHALRVDMVRRAVDAGVDELAHTPTERLPAELVERIAAARIGVVSTLQTFFSSGTGTTAAANAADLVEAGVTLRYGTDLGNIGTGPGVDPRELDRLADAGLGRLGALRAATEGAAAAPGIRGRTGRLRMGEPAALVVLPGDPLQEPGLWRTVVAVVADGRLLLPTDTPEFARMDDVHKYRGQVRR